MALVTHLTTHKAVLSMPTHITDKGMCHWYFRPWALRAGHVVSRHKFSGFLRICLFNMRLSSTFDGFGMLDPEQSKARQMFRASVCQLWCLSRGNQYLHEVFQCCTHMAMPVAPCTVQGMARMH